MKHLPLLLQVSAVRVDGRWISGRRSPELRVPSCFPDSSTSRSFFSSSSFVSRLSAQPPLLHPWHAAGQLPDGPPQRPLHSHHCLHDDDEPERSVQDEPITPSLVRFIGTELSFLAHPLLPRHAALQWTGRKNKDKCHTKAHTKMHKRQTVTKKSEYIIMTPWIFKVTVLPENLTFMEQSGDGWGATIPWSHLVKQLLQYRPLTPPPTTL